MERITVFDGEFWAHKNFPPVKDDTVDEFVDCVKELAARLAAYEETGLDPEELAQAKKDGQLVFITEKMAFAMIAGARAIEKNKRLQGVIYNYDIFGELGAPKVISYFEAAKVLREAAEAALEAQRGENNA